MATINLFDVPHVYELTPAPGGPQRPVLVFIHGWLLSRHYWQPLIEGLAGEYQCLTYDLRGFGDSATPSANRGYSLAAYAEDVKALLVALQIESAWLIGHSLGGSIALWAADLCRDRVRGAICLNSGGGIYLKEEFERFRQAGQQLVQRRPPWLLHLPLLDRVLARMMVYRPLARCWGRQRLIDLVKASTEAALGALLETTTEAEVHLLPQVVARLPQPVYFLAGDRDRIMELKYVLHLASFHHLFRNGIQNTIEIADCGHMSMLEQPQVAIAHLLQILSQESCLQKQQQT
ncbi:MAG: alpha/beta hydrolase [Jaaginema sp. PMC 1079.18]|nr:alpha/beta hydrolase [Jaaginema sp. PMC 1080.18]MEC4851533.1 alpha/beta hydrolase [Jaaginema sp. PMC 1079.18]MEC4865757.1 alpha/beta hydrolase [Jaaginema sp. PMC 1078.18]